MKSLKFILLLLICSLIGINMQAQGLKAFKLPNGLSVFIWEDASSPNVFGRISVNVGAKEDPEEYTGLAHYLEHMMFKGTEKIGALDWAKEKPVYEQIIVKYDEMAKETDPEKRKVISKEINDLTKEAAKYSLSNEFSNLTLAMGGEDLNAGTSYDYTIYHSSFPPGEVYKWLELNSERLINPVFRNFQPELETVYEEYNRGQDQQSRRISEFITRNLFAGHPYSRSIIGLSQHLKNPQLSQLIKFYNDWYVPSNMALILVGNIKTNEVLPIIREKFGRLENKPVPEKKVYPETELKGRKEFSAKIAYTPEVLLAYKGITSSDEDDIALDICVSILSNGNKTGLLDKLALDGDVLGAGASAESLLDRGTISVYAIPAYDMNQRRFESLKSAEKLILKEIKKLQDGQFEDWLVQSVKSKMIREYDLMMESNESKAGAISGVFLAGRDMGELLNYKEMVSEITTEQIKEIAKKYFGPDYMAFMLNDGKPPKGEKLEKPKYDPILPVRGAESAYAKEFAHLPVKMGIANYANMNEIQERKINDRSKLFYTKNPENDVFTLILKFGIGTEKMPKLALAAALMNNAGIMGQMDAQTVKQEFSNLGATCRYTVDGNYLYVTLYGFEESLEASCNLLTRQILLPKLDEKQMNNQKSPYYQARAMEKTSTENMASAMNQYVLYQDKSSYINRLSLEEIREITVSNLTGEFQRATDYEAEIHYAGAMDLESVYDILSKNLPLKEGEKPSTSPEVKDRVEYRENTIYFLSNSDAQQSSISFYIQGDDYNHESDVYRSTFNQYFAGGFSGLVLQEIREYRSMAYTAGAAYLNPPVEGKKTYLIGQLGTQSDKTVEAIDVFMELINNMPEYTDRMPMIKNYMKETALTEKPHFRSASQIYEVWKRRGYAKSPAETNMSKIDNLTFDDIVRFYNQNVKGRPVAIGIVGDPKLVDLKALEKYGKVVKVNVGKLFSDK
ncbi:MAG: insulinase family protein [Dysgonamonadaceae bacterium]|jgi:predicted Zn-dependent peptidase|nr:insulinase family protein [Dysgonamonadaceae bacterium]